MNKDLLEQLTEEVWQRLSVCKPRALLLGETPDGLQKFNYVNKKPYDAVVIGVLPPGELLHMPSDPVCSALLEGIPVYLWQGQPYRRSKSARLLRRELAAAEKRLLQYGVLPLGGETGRLITAQEARAFRLRGEQPAVGSRLTPLARDVLEGKSP